MPYLGNEPAVAYTSTTKDSFSGDGSTTDFTMSKSANVNAVRVVVENVVQNPTVAYTCSGTTLSFTSAPPTGTNNIYVVHLGPPAATIAPPTTINNATTFTGGISGDLAVDTNTLFVDSTNNHVGFGTTTPAKPLSVNLAGGGDFIAEFQNTTDATPYGIHVKDAASGANGYPLFQVTSGDGSSTYFRVDSGTGITTKPTQPAFAAKMANNMSALSPGVNTTMTFDTEEFDQNADYNTSNYTFTAPVNGRYQLNAILYINTVDADMTFYQMYINTSNRIFYNIIDPRSFDQDPAYWGITIAALGDMDAGDTAICTLQLGTGGATQTTVYQLSHFSGYLVA